MVFCIFIGEGKRENVFSIESFYEKTISESIEGVWEAMVFSESPDDYFLVLSTAPWTLELTTETPTLWHRPLSRSIPEA